MTAMQAVVCHALVNYMAAHTVPFIRRTLWTMYTAPWLVSGEKSSMR